MSWLQNQTVSSQTRVVSLLYADNYHGPLRSRLPRVNQPVIGSQIRV
jgi:hypothetical protein